MRSGVQSRVSPGSNRFRELLKTILGSTKLTVLIAALTGGAVLATSAAMLSLVFAQVQRDIAERVIQGQERAVRIGATLLEQAHPKTEVAWSERGDVERIVIDELPSFSDHRLVDTMTRITGEPASLFKYDRATDDFVRLSTTVRKADGSRAVGTMLGRPSPAYEPNKRGEKYSGRADILGVPHYTSYEPIFDHSGAVIGIIFSGVKVQTVVESEQALIWRILIASAVLIAIMSSLSLLAARAFLRPVPVLASAMEIIAKSDLSHAIPYTDWKNEIGGMARALVGFRDQSIEKIRLEKEAETLAQIEASRRALELKNIELDRAADKLEVALNNMGRGLSMFDAEHRLVVCNNAYRDIYALPESATPTGVPFSSLVRYHAERENAAACPQVMDETNAWLRDRELKLAEGKPFTEIQNLSDGRVVNVSVMPLAKGGWVGIVEDITERLRQETQISHMAGHDPLTDLANRSALLEHLETLLAGPRGQRQFAVHFIDLDHFKDVNDTLGHHAGDRLLKEVSERLKSCIREGDFIARLGGDEFAIVQADVHDANGAHVLAARVMEAIDEAFDLDGQRALIGASVGIAISPHDGSDSTTLLKHADLALYQSKKNRVNRINFYDPAMSATAHARRDLELELRTALADGQFELFYQPQVSAGTSELRGFEALLRWRHPQRGLVSPAEFIPLAEETGLIVPIGCWVLRQACAQAQSWPKHVTIAVNVSALQLKVPNFVEGVVLALAESGLAPHRLEIEITEWAFVESSGATLEILRKLHDLGVRLSLDDFGTGYSSLNYLRLFPIDKIKIDRSFVKEAAERTNALAIIRALADLGRSLGLVVCAEGVETEAQFAQVCGEGCSEVQGYLTGRPEPAAVIESKYFPQRQAMLAGAA